MTKERTSVSLDEVNYEYVQRTDLSFSELLNEAINKRRLAATKSRPEQLRKQINEKEEELQEAEAKVRDIEAELQQLKEELELYEQGERDMVDDLLEAAEYAIYVGPDDRDNHQLSMAEQAGLTPEMLADALEYADVHSVRPAAFSTHEAMEDMHYYDNDERLIIPDELDTDDGEEAYTDQPDHLVQLTKTQEEKLKQWARQEI